MIQIQLETLIAERRGEVAVSKPNIRSNVKVTKPPIFNEDASKFSGFLIVYKLYIRMRVRNISVKKQIQ